MSKQLLSSLAITAIVASVAAAQQTATPTPRPGTTTSAPGAAPATQPVQPGHSGQLDHGIAACLHLSNQEEIALAQFAESRAQHDDVKKFAAMLLKDHRAALQKLEGVAPQLASMNLQLQGAAAGGQPAAAATTTARPGQPAGQAAGDVGATMIALQRRIAEECLTLTQKELSDKQGPEFDRCFIGQQMGAHVATLAKLRGSREFASPQLQQFIDEATQVVEHHLTEAKQIAKKLEGAHGSHGDNEQARRDGTQSQRQ